MIVGREQQAEHRPNNHAIHKYTNIPWEYNVMLDRGRNGSRAPNQKERCDKSQDPKKNWMKGSRAFCERKKLSNVSKKPLNQPRQALKVWQKLKAQERTTRGRYQFIR